MIHALASAGSRLDAAHAADLATYLLAWLNRAGITEDAQRPAIEALASLIGKLDAAEAAKVVASLRGHLHQRNVDANTKLLLIDTVASMAAAPGPHPTDEQIDGIRITLASVAWPLHDPSESPA